MDLKIFELENKLRNNLEKINDNDLIKLDSSKNINDYKPINIPNNNKNIMINSKFDGSKIFSDFNNFNKRLFNMTGGMLSYINWDNIVLAGGCISNVINSNCSDKFVTDIDLFVYGLNKDDAITKISTIISNLQEYCKDNFTSDMYILKNDYVITLIPTVKSKRIFKTQIILRLYKNIHEILIGFDVDSCCVGYDGKNILLTPRSLNAFKTGYNVIDLTRRSPSYESRLYKYYKRGFGIYIPFEYQNKNNKLYFINQNSLGLDKLLYLIKYNKIKNLNKFLNIMTQRVNKRFKNDSFASYEEQELIFDEDDIRNEIVKYNKRITDDKFKYKLYDKYSKLNNKINFIVQNPGQQLTGSFNPITNQDWIVVDYSNSNIDFLGRSNILNSIKNNSIQLDAKTRSLDVYDNSMFNIYCNMIMYTHSDDELIKNYELKDMFAKNKNLYNISYINLATLLNRQKLVKYILEKNKDITNISFEQLIEICLFMDNVNMLLILQEFHKFNIKFYEDKLKKYNSLSIANYYCIKINKYQQLDDVQKIVNMDTSSRKAYLHNLWYKWGYYYNIVNINDFFTTCDYNSLTVDEIKMITTLEHSNKQTLYDKCLENLIKTYTLTDNQNVYSENSFEHKWFNIIFKQTNNNEKLKDTNKNLYSIKILKEVFYKSDDEVNKLVNIEFKNPIKDINPFVLEIMKNVYNNNFKAFQDYKKIYRRDNNLYEPLKDLLIYLDNIEILNAVIESSYVEEFLKINKQYLNSNLGKYITDLENSRINLQKDDVFTRYAKVLCNTPDHISVFKIGKLNKKYSRIENVFGLTPCDYVINKLLYFYNSIINHNETVNEDILLLLTNLRQSLHNINLEQSVMNISLDKCVNQELDNMLDII